MAIFLVVELAGPCSIKKTSKPIFMTNGGCSCSLCDSKEHLTFQCSAFKELSSSERRKRVKGLHLCFNCLSAGHKSESCQSHYSCRTCGQRLHTLIHLSESKETNREMDPINHTLPSLVATNIADEQHALFIICQVLVDGPGGKVKARALIDPVSAISLATNHLAATVKAEKIKRTTNMSGLQSSPLPGSKYTVSLKFSSVYDSSMTVPLKAALLKGITADLPAAEISSVKELPCFQGLQLADSAFDKPGRVDLLLGLRRCIFSDTASWTNPGPKRQSSLCITVHFWLDNWRHSKFTFITCCSFGIQNKNYHF